MSEAKKEILETVAAKLEAEGIPVPSAFKGKLSTEESLILHVFLDHLYMQVLPNLKQARKELESYEKQIGETPTELLNDLADWFRNLESSLKEGYDIYASRIDVVPDLATMKVFKKKLEEELDYALQLSLDKIAEKQELSGNNGNGNSASK